MEPLAARLAELRFRQAMLVPCGTLGLLPLPVLHRSPVAFSLVPSARALQTALAIGSRNGEPPPALLAVEDPSGNLPSAAIEVEQIRRFFPKGQRRHLRRRQATLEATAAALDGVTHLHLACHGTYHADRPLESALILAGGERLTLRDLLDGRIDLSTVQLAVLSACETGVFDVKRAPDETIGLPAGLLQAGVPAVISTLWSVADVSTALLLGEFYRLHLGEGMTAPIALSRAQAWLRDATAGELRLADHYQRLYRRTPNQGFARKFRRYRSAPDVRPFADPYYWAPFVFSGVD